MTLLDFGIDDKLLRPIAHEVARQDAVQALHSDRDGIRLALACMEDELSEAHDSWDSAKRNEGLPDQWEEVELELRQLAALVLRTLRSIEAAAR